MGRLTGAGSDALLSMVTGAPRSAVVVGAGPYATYLEVEPAQPDAPSELLALVSRDAVRVPCAIVLADGPALLPGLVRGVRARVGAGAVRWDGGELAVVRWWPAASVSRKQQPPSADQRAALGTRLAAARTLVGAHGLPPGVPPALDQAVVALDDGDPAASADAVRPVLGTGAGLTPSADDAVAGMLLAALSWRGSQVAATVSDVGRLLAPGLTRRTTAVSAGLLLHAAEGRGAPEVVRAVEHLTGRAVATDGHQVLADLVRLGHSSGRDTAVGTLTYLERQHPDVHAHPLTDRESA